MGESENKPTPMAFAYGWVARMTTVVLEMALPGLGGQWLDSRWGTNYWAIVGFGIGFALGLYHLLHMVKQQGSYTGDGDHSSDQNK